MDVGVGRHRHHPQDCNLVARQTGRVCHRVVEWVDVQARRGDAVDQSRRDQLEPQADPAAQRHHDFPAPSAMPSMISRAHSATGIASSSDSPETPAVHRARSVRAAEVSVSTTPG
jgi:hypothetical protein